MAFDTFFLLGSILLLAAVAWSMRKRDFATASRVWPSAALAAACGALCLFHLLRFSSNFEGWPEGRLLMAAVTVASLSAAMILMGLRTLPIWREGRSSQGS